MRDRALTPTQSQIMLSLHQGWRWGADHRSLPGLIERGLIVLLPHRIEHHDHVSELALPWLTERGAVVAAEIWRDQTGDARPVKGTKLRVIDGGADRHPHQQPAVQA